MNPIIKCLLAAVVACSFLLNPAAHAGERLDHINKNGVLRVGTPGDYSPFAIKRDQAYAGHDVDVVQAMADALGVKIEWVDTSWPNLLADLHANKFDVAVGGITRTAARIGQADMLPGYAPFSKVALIRAADKQRFQSLSDLDQPDVKVIKNPGGTNEAFVLEHLKNASVQTHDKNAEIPGLIAEGEGNVMITETYEALHYAAEDERLAIAAIEPPLTPVNRLGFLLPADDADYLRVMHFAWDLLDQRGTLDTIEDEWLR